MRNVAFAGQLEQVEVICPGDFSEVEPMRDMGGLLGVGCEIAFDFVGAIGGFLSIGC